MDRQHPHPEWMRILGHVNTVITGLEEINTREPAYWSISPKAAGRNGHGPNRILVVEDNPGDRLLTKVLLEEAGFDSVFAAGFEPAIAEITRGVGAVILDWRLPASWGSPIMILDAARRNVVPVCIYSGFEDPSEYSIPWMTKSYPEQLINWLGEVVLVSSPLLRKNG